MEGNAISDDYAPPSKTTVVIDRFAGDIAVLLVGVDQQVVNVPRDQLPAGAQPGQWLRVRWDGAVITQLVIDDDATAAARQRSAATLARLRRGDHLHES